MLEERKGKNLTWRVFRGIGATLVGFNQINLRNLNFDKKNIPYFVEYGGGDIMWKYLNILFTL